MVDTGRNPTLARFCFTVARGWPLLSWFKMAAGAPTLGSVLHAAGWGREGKKPHSSPFKEAEEKSRATCNFCLHFMRKTWSQAHTLVRTGKYCSPVPSPKS